MDRELLIKAFNLEERSEDLLRHMEDACKKARANARERKMAYKQALKACDKGDMVRMAHHLHMMPKRVTFKS